MLCNNHLMEVLMTLNISKRTLRVLTIMMVFGGISVSGTEGVPTGVGQSAEPAAGASTEAAQVEGSVGATAEQAAQDKKKFSESFNQFMQQFKDLNQKWKVFTFNETDTLEVLDEKIQELEGILGEYKSLQENLKTLLDNVKIYSKKDVDNKIAKIKDLQNRIKAERIMIQKYLREISSYTESGKDKAKVELEPDEA